MSFLIDPPLLVATGAAVERLADADAADRLERVCVALFLATSISLYANLSPTRWMSSLLPAESGRDWMLNSGLLRLEHRRPRRSVHAASAVLFAIYPLWFRLGRRLGREREPRRG